jgi:hypothetical protein
MNELGLFGVTIPEEYGGMGLDLTTYAMIVEELSRAWISISGASRIAPPPLSGGSRLLDQVDVVRDAVWLPSAYGDEHTVVEPRQFGVRGLDAHCGPERVFGGVDVLPSRQACEHVWIAVAYTVRLDVEQRPRSVLRV